MLQPNGGFTFNGISCKSLGIEYAPELNDTYVYNGDKYKNNEESFEAHDGGYYYGSTVEVKEFTLRCFYEEREINKGILTKVASAFRRGTTGKLVFDSRPWLWYMATVTGIETTKITNYLNGFVTIKMKAYYPYARYDSLYIDDNNPYYYNIKRNSALLDAAVTPPTAVVTTAPITGQSEYILFNGGTERAKVAVKIQGDVGLGGVIIANATTNQKMRIVGMTDLDDRNNATSGTDYYICDGMTGKCMLNTDLKFEWHDYGFIELEPAYPLKKDIPVYASLENNRIKLTSDYLFTKDDIGKYIYIDNNWREILSYYEDSNTLIAFGNNITEGDYVTNIVTMNKIIVTPISTMNITKLEFIYKPTFS